MANCLSIAKGRESNMEENILLLALKKQFDRYYGDNKSSYYYTDSIQIKSELSKHNIDMELFEVYELWSMYSDESLACWLVVYDETLSRFIEWVKELIGEDE